MGMVMRSGYNGALVVAVEYTGEATALSWELQHSLCAAAGRATPGSDLSGSLHPERTSNLNKDCAYSATDNHVVAGQLFSAFGSSLTGATEKSWMPTSMRFPCSKPC